MVVKEETNDVKASSTSCIYLGSKAKSTELHMAKDQQKLQQHQFTTQIFLSEVSFISDRVLGHTP
jgi:hypothetical protein